MSPKPPFGPGIPEGLLPETPGLLGTRALGRQSTTGQHLHGRKGRKALQIPGTNLLPGLPGDAAGGVVLPLAVEEQRHPKATLGVAVGSPGFGNASFAPELVQIPERLVRIAPALARGEQRNPGAEPLPSVVPAPKDHQRLGLGFHDPARGVDVRDPFPKGAAVGIPIDGSGAIEVHHRFGGLPLALVHHPAKAMTFGVFGAFPQHRFRGCGRDVQAPPSDGVPTATPMLGPKPMLSILEFAPELRAVALRTLNLAPCLGRLGNGLPLQKPRRGKRPEERHHHQRGPDARRPLDAPPNASPMHPGTISAQPSMGGAPQYPLPELRKGVQGCPGQSASLSQRDTQAPASLHQPSGCPPSTWQKF